MRDLLRKRSQLVRQRTTQILSIQNLLARNLSPLRPAILSRGWQAPDIDALALLPEQALAVQANLAVMHCLDEQIHGLEHAILERATLREDYRALQTVSGIGKVLALTIALETGDIGRFASPGNFASYARTVSSRRESNGKKKEKATPSARQPAPGLGLRRSGALCGALQRTHQALLPEEERPHAAGGSHQGGGPQAGAGELPRHEER